MWHDFTELEKQYTRQTDFRSPSPRLLALIDLYDRILARIFREPECGYAAIAAIGLGVAMMAVAVAGIALAYTGRL